jgi:hypothetical protein
MVKAMADREVSYTENRRSMCAKQQQRNFDVANSGRQGEDNSLGDNFVLRLQERSRRLHNAQLD